MLMDKPLNMLNPEFTYCYHEIKIELMHLVLISNIYIYIYIGTPCTR